MYSDDVNVNDLLTPKYLIYGMGINARKNSDWYDVVELKNDKMRRSWKLLYSIIIC